MPYYIRRKKKKEKPFPLFDKAGVKIKKKPDLVAKLDKVFSRYIRLRDCMPNGYFRCISCGKIKPYEQADCGHFHSRRHMATRFDEDNAHAECKSCNRFSADHLIHYEKNLKAKIGQLRFDKLAWREFIRMEFELGECRNAQFLLQCALDLFPQDLSFKIKQVRVNERLQDEKELLRMVQSVTQKQSSKFSRILMNCLLSLGRLGNQKAIAELERLVFSIPYCMFLETYEFFYYYVNAFSYTFMLSVIMHLIRKKVKKDCFLVYAHEYVEYLFLNMDAADGQTKYAKLYHQLLPSTQKSYQEKGHWEVFLSRMQYRTRIILLIYAKALQEVVHS